MADIRDVPTPHGPARVHVFSAVGTPKALVALGHGAGKGVTTSDLQGLARDLPAHGVSVALVDQPWVVAGRRVAAPAPQLDRAWNTVVNWLRAEGLVPGDRLVAGGRSTGARVVCRTTAEVRPSAVLLLSFPLLPPAAAKDPQRAAKVLGVRMQEWASAGHTPIVLAQGERDVFGNAEAICRALADRGAAMPVTFVVPAADHSMKAPAALADEVTGVVLGAALEAVRLGGGALRE